MGPALRADTWQTPRIVSFTSRDGLRVSAQLFMPASGDRARQYPAIVQVHEASAMNQHVFVGLGPQKNHVGWYGWHQRLAERGFVVLNVDYRGSFGYGRSFRTADYLVMGQAPLEDAVAGVEFLRTLGNIDPDRIAAVGLSAGGRMVLSLLAKYPDTFAAGVDLAGIYDYLLPGGPWDTRNSWTTARLDTPEAHPEAYRDASPKTFVSAITRPLLVLHGTADTNVPITHSLALVQDLVASGKRFDFAVYPGEVHFFARRTSWLDAFERMETFLDRELAPRKTGERVGHGSAAGAAHNTTIDGNRQLAGQD
jgi:dipeptidyl aminopeptidase/acylaminoacyl peptidase